MFTIRAPLARDFREYEGYHRNPANKITHYVGIPLLTVAIAGLLRPLAFPLVSSWTADLAQLLILAAVLFAWRRDPRMSLIFTAYLGAAYWLAGFLSWQWLPILFVFGWILQFVGHYLFEKQAPAFTTNLRHILVGPLWILHRMLGTRLPQSGDSPSPT